MTTAVKEIDAQIKALTSEIAKLTKQRDALQQQAFGDRAKALFDKHPALKSFTWNQYTPLWNDGDVCRFRCNTEDVTINGLDEDETSNLTSKTLYKDNPDFVRGVTDWNKRYIEVPNPEYNAELAKAKAAVEKFLRGFQSKYYEAAFGDHAEVTVTRKGVTVEEYDHE